jgi:hypothetical protein
VKETITTAKTATRASTMTRAAPSSPLPASLIIRGRTKPSGSAARLRPRQSLGNLIV